MASFVTIFTHPMYLACIVRKRAFWPVFACQKDGAKFSMTIFFLQSEVWWLFFLPNFIQPLPQETWRKTFNYSYMKWDEVNTVSNWSSEGYLVPMISTTKLIGFFVSSGQGRHLGETGHLGDAEEALQPLRSAGGRYEDNHRRWVSDPVYSIPDQSERSKGSCLVKSCSHLFCLALQLVCKNDNLSSRA